MSFHRVTAIAVVICGLGLGCSDPSDAFHGVWEPVSTPSETVVVNGEPLLALGHYGREAAGVMYYRVPGGSRFEQLCPCAFVEHLSYNAADTTMKFETACGDATSRHLWNLELLEDPADGQRTIAATVSYANGEGGIDYVEFQRIDSEVPSRFKACPPE